MTKVYFYLYREEVEVHIPHRKNGEWVKPVIDITYGEVVTSKYFESAADAANDRNKRKFPLTPLMEGWV